MQTQCRHSLTRRCTATTPGAPLPGLSVRNSWSRGSCSSLQTSWLVPGGLDIGCERVRAPKQQVLCRATQQQQQQKQRQQQVPLQWPADLQLREADVLRAASEESLSGPILSGAGGGLFFWWELGASSLLPCRVQTVTITLHQANYLHMLLCASTQMCSKAMYCKDLDNCKPEPRAYSTQIYYHDVRD